MMTHEEHDAELLGRGLDAGADGGDERSDRRLDGQGVELAVVVDPVAIPLDVLAEHAQDAELQEAVQQDVLRPPGPMRHSDRGAEYGHKVGRGSSSQSRARA